MSLTVTPPEKHYASFISDASRWDGFKFRSGDIIICTPAKCGTTWTQMICGCLIFQTADFYKPLAEITPWLDMHTRDLAAVFADLDAQEHRRFIKTHTPIDGLPWSDEITYISAGRDPRDVGVSMDNHMQNMNLESLLNQRFAVAGVDDLEELFPDGIPAPLETQAERFWHWVDEETPPEKVTSTLAGTLHHFNVAWSLRDHSNVVLMHYADLKADREGQMRDLARRLGIEIPEAKWPELVNATSFEYMKEHADFIVPNADQDLWQAVRDFFRSGKNGQWHDYINDDASRAHYENRVASLTTPEISAWAHRGS